MTAILTLTHITVSATSRVTIIVTQIIISHRMYHKCAHVLLIILQINYKLFNAARDKSAMNYQVGRFDMEMEPDVNSSFDHHRIMCSTSCPRHSYKKCVKLTSLQNTHIKNTIASTVSHICYISIIDLVLMLIFIYKKLE